MNRTWFFDSYSGRTSSSLRHLPFAYISQQRIHFEKMAEQKKQASFTKVKQLLPSKTGLNLTVKVVSSKLISQRGRSQSRVAECLVGDETGIVVFLARNDQVDLMQEGTTVVLTNARVEIHKGSMRLVVDRYGRAEVTDAASFSVQKDNNLSLIEFERVEVVV